MTPRELAERIIPPVEAAIHGVVTYGELCATEVDRARAVNRVEAEIQAVIADALAAQAAEIKELNCRLANMAGELGTFCGMVRGLLLTCAMEPEVRARIEAALGRGREGG